MPSSPVPGPESPQELAWRRANPLLAELSTARIRELQAEQTLYAKALAASVRDEQALRDWIVANMDPLPGF
jgi:hypothetical protein